MKKSKLIQGAAAPGVALLLSTSLLFVPGWRTHAQEAVSSASVEKTTFHEVTSHLDPGGSLYAYLSLNQWLSGLSDRIGEFRDTIVEAGVVEGTDLDQLKRVFDVVIDATQRTGIEAVTGAGVSGIAIDQGLYRTKFFVHRNPSSDANGIWSVFGTSPHPLQPMSWLPDDTVWADFGDLDVNAIWQGINELLHQHEIQPLIEGLEAFQTQFQQATGKSFNDTIGSLAGEVGAFVTLSKTSQISVPGPDGSSLEIPEPGILLSLKVKDPTLFEIANQLLSNNPSTISSEEGDTEFRILPLPVPLPMTVRLTIARHGDYLWIASNDALIKRFLAVQNGDAPALKDTDEFKKLAAGLPTEGNSFAFISGRFNQTVQDVVSRIVAQEDAAGGGKFVQKILSNSRTAAGLTVTQRLPDGWFSVSNGTQRPENLVLLPVVVAPAAIVSSMLLPALSKAKAKAQSIKCMNNLKQIGLATLMYADDHDGHFPDDLMDAKDNLVTPKILICPESPLASSADELTWETFDPEDSSYEYFGKGMTTAVANPQDTVVTECKFHHSKCYADGHVVMGAQ